MNLNLFYLQQSHYYFKLKKLKKTQRLLDMESKKLWKNQDK